MGNRLSKIVTRTGDAGTTGLGDGSRIAKDSLRIDVIGEVDELNSFIGVLLAEELPGNIHDLLLAVQHDLFDIGGEVCIPVGYTAIKEDAIERLEASVEEINETLTPLKEFILPGGTRPAAIAHLARSVCRRVERRVVRLANVEPVSENIRKYFNRLSDLLFVLGRALNKVGGRGDVPWAHTRVKKPRD
ncbi:MAG: cob(I)yrinic acid a,c-diamide adenosyltransferase [Candidatus Accumulibacter sp.]|jgi:cob(I)alamin adenosyltransferase|nr:cob(I)yrinic acid a,c-diamide adenosyltransferase [Accumulibacter sp.]